MQKKSLSIGNFNSYESIDTAIIRSEKVKNVVLNTFYIVFVLFGFATLTSCHSDYCYYISGNHDDEYVKIADTMGVKVYLYNRIDLNVQHTRLAIERDSQFVELKDIVCKVSIDGSKCFNVNELLTYYGTSRDKSSFRSVRLKSETKQNSDFIPDSLKAPDQKYKWLEFFFSFNNECKYHRDSVKNVQTQIIIHIAINDIDVYIENKSDYKKVKYHYSRWGSCFYYEDKE